MKMDEVKKITDKSLSKNGIVLKCIGGFYYIIEIPDGGENDDVGEVFECRARGKFRLDGVAPRVGDRVRFEIDQGESKGGYLVEILHRDRILKRPSVANVTQFALVLSAHRPKPDFLLADKLLIQAERCDVKAIIIINKLDLARDDLMDKMSEDYANLPYRFLTISAKTGENLDELRNELRGEISCLAGQSAVGKSSILNALCRRLQLETGGVSRKTGRGRHTTRASELWPLEGEKDSYIVDTPGFSLLELEDLEPEDLQGCYPEFRDVAGKCRFDNCLHQNEPDCAGKEKVKNGEMSKGRYERYLLILEELDKIKNNKYN